GLDRGDIQDIRIIGPDGTVLVKASRPVKEDQAVALVFIGRKADPGAAWPPGHYKGEYELIRQVDGQPKPVAHAEREFVLR
ncbi:MAG TPA: M23 family peptidase, partial [Dongiaceae bacterium]|nr:M23 family peptidase [Dongiaceae bacterium]